MTTLCLESLYEDAAKSFESILGRGYVYVSGGITEYSKKPQIELTDTSQLSDIPPGNL
jgi:hypothetical protein